MTLPRDTPGRAARATKADTIARTLRDEIELGVIAQGERLQQDDLARRFSTSITPVREALYRLEAEGLLDRRAHQDMIVAQPNFEQITSIFMLRRTIEPLAAQRAALRLSRRDIERAREINALYEEAVAEQDQVLARRLNHDFHFLFYNAIELPTLTSEIERLWAAFPWATLLVGRGRAMESQREHREMIEAVGENDQEAIVAAFTGHITRGYLRLARELTGSESLPEPFG